MLSDEVSNSEGSSDNDRYSKVKIRFWNTLFHKPEGNKGQTDDKSGRNGKKSSDVEHDSTIEQKQKANKHQKHSNEQFIGVNQPKQRRNLIDRTSMNGPNDQYDQILSDLVIIHRELLLWAY